ncbi:hypothetical protein ACX5K5_10185 [Glutamicibacter bergerei]|jgi:hypothetical protein|uniref:Integral membrane protein n=2 Tax=Glutamicibacter TaxID=1742989 RepID=A0ABV9MQU8_9MICC|nr:MULTISPECIES: hypothetical protein [Glutamicibacter]PCC32236.1 hypothetical protein CIK74_15465 [Glutamicibacter sp. BW77]GGJ62860.1 hypothetical protein GCM10007173_22170 [Glutamicibacter ardleyensis]HBV10343.1 hypothetical protein [Micrococcaceae bacterium]
MTFLTLFLVFLHILGAAAIFGGWLANFKTPTVNVWQWYGAIAQLVTGLALVGMAEANDGDVNHVKIGVKVVIAIIIAVAAFLGRKKIKAGEEVPTGLAHATGGMALINIAIAVLWV